MTAVKDKIMPHLEKNRHLRETQSLLEYLADKILTGDIRSALNNQSISKYKKDTSEMQMKPTNSQTKLQDMHSSLLFQKVHKSK